MKVETARLILRPPTADDVQGIFDGWAGQPEVTRYLAWRTHASITDTQAFLERADREWAKWGCGALLLTARDDGRLIGSTGLHFDAKHRAEVGYVVAKAEWGKGYASEALSAIAKLGASLGARRIQATCHIEHRASAHVLAKCGFRLEGVLRQHSVFPNLGRGIPEAVECWSRIS